MHEINAMHERALKAIFVLQHNQLDVSARMGIDTRIPLHKRLPLPPTKANICRAADVLGVSVKWLTTGIPETETDRFVVRQISGTNGSVVVRDNRDCRITVHNVPVRGI